MSMRGRDLPGDDKGLSPNAHPTRADFVRQQLREAILFGSLRPGEPIVPTDLTARWNVSLTPLREAIQRLAAEGLVELTPQRGARVTQVSTRDLLEIYQLRLLLEPLALRLSVQRGDERYRRQIMREVQALVAAYGVEPLDRAVCEAAHREFHLGIVSRCQSAWLRRIVALLIDHSARYRILSTPYRGGPQRVIEEHQDIRAICVAGDPEPAAERLRAHLQTTVDSVLRYASEIGELGSDDVPPELHVLGESVPATGIGTTTTDAISHRGVD